MPCCEVYGIEEATEGVVLLSTDIVLMPLLTNG
jgi:hypothetical protein